MPLDLAAVYDEHAQAIYAFLLSVTRHQHETRELLQEIFLKLAAQPALLDRAHRPRAFLLRMAHNLAIDRFRRQRRETSLPLDEIGFLFAPEDDPDQRALAEALTSAMADLPEDQRAVVHLKLWEELTFAEIAEVLRLSPNTAASRYRYGLDKLRDRLRPLFEELP